MDTNEESRRRIGPRAALAIVLVVSVGMLATGFISQTATPTPPPAAVEPTETPAPIETPDPEPAPVETVKPEPSETAQPEPEESTATLADAIRAAFPEAPKPPGVKFFEGVWGDYTEVTDDRVGQPGTYAGMVGMPSSYEPRLVEFAGGTATVTPKRFDAFKDTTELEIIVN